MRHRVMFVFMFILDPAIKTDPVKRWNLPDRIFFAHGACHILAGVALNLLERDSPSAHWLRPADPFEGNHVFVTVGDKALDYRGCLPLGRLLEHHRKGWSGRYPGWSADLVRVDFDLLDTQALNLRNMRGPDQFLHDPIPRARAYLARHVN